MMPKFQKMLEERAKKAKKMSGPEKQAKMDAVREIDGMASKMMSDKLRGIKQVSVAAPDKEGLQKGLDMAEEIVGGDEAQDSKDQYESDESKEEASSEEKESSEDQEQKEPSEEAEESKEDKIRRLEEELENLKRSEE